MSARILIALGGLLMFGIAAPKAQPPREIQTGLHYYAIQDLNTGAVTQRGIAGSNGIAFDQLILAPNTPFRIWILQPSTHTIADPSIISPENGRLFPLPELPLRFPLPGDPDLDGLTDEEEFIIGTNRAVADTDGDGVADGAEVEQGLDPLDGFPARTGIISSAATPGKAVDISASNNMAIMACSGAGVAVFNIFNGMSPVILAQIPTTGPATAVAGSDLMIAAVTGATGLAIIDMSTPAMARVIHQVFLGGTPQCVTAAAGTAYAGLTNGQIVAVDMASGMVIDRLTVGGSVQDLFLAGDALYAINQTKIFAIPLGATMSVSYSANSPSTVAGSHRFRLVAGGAAAYATHRRGFNTFDLTNPLSPTLIAAGNTAQIGWKQLVVNGSGLGVAAVGPNTTETPAQDNISLYDASDLTKTDQFITTFVTPGVATAVSIYNGRAYVADGDAGLQEINYLAYDSAGVAPEIAVSASFPIGEGAEVEEGKLARFSADVSDDVQVRNVEFYINGVKVGTDGNFPFEHRFITPRRNQGLSFRIRARAFDTGGNSTWSENVTVQLLPDTTPPQVRGVVPGPNRAAPPTSTLVAYLNEPISSASLTGTAFQLFAAGTDGLPGTPDDTPVNGGTMSRLPQGSSIALTFPTPLPGGLYRAQVGPPLADLPGNVVQGTYRWMFRLFSGTDDDNDGVPDAEEPGLGLDTGNPDTDGDGIADGLEDFDGDGLSNEAEVFLGTNPSDSDTNDNGTNDSSEDADLDGLTVGGEIAAGTSPFLADTDGDTWPDGAEVEGGSNPLDDASTPKLLVIAPGRVQLVLPSSAQESGLNTVTAAPQVSIVLPSSAQEDGFGKVIASPPVAITLPSFSATTLNGAVFMASPPVQVVAPGTQPGGALPLNVTVADPPVQIVAPASNDPVNPPNTTVAAPPVTVEVPTSGP